MSLQINFNAFKKSPFAWDAQPRMLGSGGQAVVFEDKGTAVKLFYSNRYMSDESIRHVMERELATLQWLQAHNASDIQTPEPIEMQWFARAHPFAIFSKASSVPEPHDALGYIRMSVLEGEMPAIPQTDQVALTIRQAGSFRELGRVMAVFQQIGCGASSLPDCATTDPLVSRFRKLVSGDAAAPYFSRHDIAILADDYVSLRNMLDQPVLAHGDLYLKQVLCKPGSQRITGVVDWGSAALTIQGRDFAHYALTADRPIKQLAFDNIQQGYLQAGGRTADPLVVGLYGLMRRACTIAECPDALRRDSNKFSCVLGSVIASLKQYKIQRESHPVLNAARVARFEFGGI